MRIDGRKNKRERVLLHLSAQINPASISVFKDDDKSFELSYDTTMIVGDGTYNGIYFPVEELEKSFTTFDGVPINLNHSDDRIEDIVGYVKDPYIKDGKLVAKTVFDSRTAKYNDVSGYIQSRFSAGDYPNVSIGVWLDRVEEPLSSDSSKTRTTARDLKADHLAVVVHGTCNPSDGCGIGLSNFYYSPEAATYRTDCECGTWEITFTDENTKDDAELDRLRIEIEKEKLRQQIIKERNKTE